MIGFVREKFVQNMARILHVAWSLCWAHRFSDEPLTDRLTLTLTSQQNHIVLLTEKAKQIQLI